jgi:hypothetical protein
MRIRQGHALHRLQARLNVGIDLRDRDRLR